MLCRGENRLSIKVYGVVSSEATLGPRTIPTSIYRLDSQSSGLSLSLRQPQSSLYLLDCPAHHTLSQNARTVFMLGHLTMNEMVSLGNQG